MRRKIEKEEQQKKYFLPTFSKDAVIRVFVPFKCFYFGVQFETVNVNIGFGKVLEEIETRNTLKKINNANSIVFKYIDIRFTK